MANAAPYPTEDITPARVLAAYGQGVKSLVHLAAKTPDWAMPTPCAGWTLLELAGHVLGTARSYHRLLNAALAGAPLDGLPLGPALDRRNAADLVALGPMPGPARLLAFDAVAGRYGERLADVDWTLSLGSWDGLGPLSIADHALLAAGEWHLHAWDVARSYGWDYRPDDPGVVAAGLRLVPGRQVLPGLSGRQAEGDLWEASLAAAGRRTRSSRGR